MRAMAAAVSRTGPRARQATPTAGIEHSPPMHVRTLPSNPRTARSPVAAAAANGDEMEATSSNPRRAQVLIASARVQLLEVTARQASSSVV